MSGLPDCANVFIGQYNNAEMDLNVINWLSELDYQVFLNQKEIRVERFDLTSKEKRIGGCHPFCYTYLYRHLWHNNMAQA